MKSTDLTIKALRNNPKILDFFFRIQSENEFNGLFENVEESENDVINSIEEYSDDLDYIEELFYSESFDDLCYIFGLTPIEKEK